MIVKFNSNSVKILNKKTKLKKDKDIVKIYK